MKIHRCGRCEGCGYVTGAFRWEIPWSRWAPNPEDPQQAHGVLEAHACPDCFGTGALIEMEVKRAQDRLPTRRGIARDAYAEHVEVALRMQGGRPQS